MNCSYFLSPQNKLNGSPCHLVYCFHLKIQRNSIIPMPLQHLSNTLHQTVQYWFAKEHLLDNASGCIIQGVVRGDEAPMGVCLTDLFMTVTCICSEFELAGLSMTSMWYSAWRCRSSRSSRPTLLTCRA